MNSIYEFVNRLPKTGTIFEIGAHKGEDSVKLAAAVPDGYLHLFEPDPRNHDSLVPLIGPKVRVNVSALSSTAGIAKLHQSDAAGDLAGWAGSSSLLAPKEHLREFPHVSFPTTTSVIVETLDDYCKTNAITSIDFVWMDTQGSEYNILLGSANMIRENRIGAIYLEYYDKEMYQGQQSLNKILGLLPDDWALVQVWPNECLVVNKAFGRKE